MKTKSQYLKIIVSLIIGVILFFLGFYLNFFITEEPYSYILFSTIKTIVLTLSITSLFLFSYFIYKTGTKKLITNIILFVISTIGILIIFEISFTFQTNSSNVFTDLSNKIWIKKYFKPINSLGYRDDEPKVQSGKKNILVIGDSFVAGHGIKTNEMFSNLMKQMIGNKYSIFNLGVCGSHTQREYDSLLTYPIKPDIIILGYYHNDIESAMLKLNNMPKFKNPKDDMNSFSRFIVDNSLFFNSLYTSYAKKSISSQFMESPQNDLLAYLNEDLWNSQQKELDKFVDYSKENNIHLIIIFFPAMGEGIAFSNVMAGSKLEEYCNSKDVKFINIYPQINDIELKNRIANPLDHHPSAEINIIIANLLEKEIIKFE